MKIAVKWVLVLWSGWVFAQEYPGVDAATMQNMIAQLQKMQACMADIGEAELKALENKNRAVEAEIDQLCKDGKRDEAHSRSLAVAMEMSGDPSVIKMRECSELMPKNMLSGNLVPQLPYTAGDVLAKRNDSHICD